MSSPLAVDDVIEITYWCRLFNQRIMTVLHARVETTPAGTSAEVQLQALVDAYLSQRASCVFLDNYIEAAGTNYTIEYVTAQRVKPTRSIYARADINVFGEFPALCTTANIAASIEKQSTKVGRKGVGRLQFGGIPGESVISGVIDSDYKNVQLKDLADVMFGGFTPGSPPGGGYRWCLPAGGTDHDYDIYNAFVQNTARTMHRRTVGLGI